MREINEVGVALIKDAEGCRLQPYRDGAGHWTVGIGHLISRGEHFGTITEEDAETLLQQDLRAAESAVEELVTVDLNDNQFAALVSFTFNLGAQELRHSSLLRDLNAGDFAGAAGQFGMWVHAGGKIEGGLVKRRGAEEALFNTPVPDPAQTSALDDSADTQPLTPPAADQTN